MNAGTNNRKPLIIILGLFLVVLMGTIWYLTGNAPAPARVLQVRGQVELIDARGNRQPVKTDDVLVRGTRVETGAASSATLAFIDDSQVLLAENSSVVLGTLYQSRLGRRSLTRLTLEGGDAESRITPRSSFNARYEVVTPALQLAVRGTLFGVRVDKQTGRTYVMVQEGVVEAQGQVPDTIRIPAGYGLVAEVGQPLTQPTELLPVPELNTLPPRVEQLPLGLRWQPLDQAHSYRVQLLSGPNYDYLIHDCTLPASQTAALIAELFDTDYQLRLRAVDAQGLEGRNAEQHFILHAHPHPPEPGATLSAPVFLAQHKVRLEWTPARTAQHYRIQISDRADFGQLISDLQELPGQLGRLSIKLPPGDYYWRAASWNPQEGYGPYSDVQTFRVEAGAPPSQGSTR